MGEVIVVAAGIDNELESKDVAAIQKLKQEKHLFYYLEKVPAEFSMVPSVNALTTDWRKHGLHMLEVLGKRLDIPETHRHFVDEILGRDRVFDDAKEIKAEVILTSHKRMLKPSLLSRFFDQMEMIFRGRKTTEVNVENALAYVSRQLQSTGKSSVAEKKLAVNEDFYEKREFKRKY